MIASSERALVVAVGATGGGRFRTTSKALPPYPPKRGKRGQREAIGCEALTFTSFHKLPLALRPREVRYGDEFVTTWRVRPLILSPNFPPRRCEAEANVYAQSTIYNKSLNCAICFNQGGMR